ncbi:unnamed protein product [Acanthoscelides obtectus]|uniref:Uncharacterized protein n=1 Tax=Acanthoscelides obtectus TaxID=200917 RepID=A0A9P0KT73_ACAOB|nr:unnamed protein product [Acanthoscelides obtectus]CAK1643163.1 hypothetical protein AOBTE_LOCUS13428 [Acanthoscelides obtectus]
MCSNHRMCTANKIGIRSSTRKYDVSVRTKKRKYFLNTWTFKLKGTNCITDLSNRTDFKKKCNKKRKMCSSTYFSRDMKSMSSKFK